MITIDNYYKKREEIVEKNLNLVGNVLDEEETKVSVFLEQIKKEFESSFDDVPYNMPVLKDDRISKNRLYDFCKRLPKGADLHVHGTSLMPMEYFIDFLLRHDEVLFCTEDHILYNEDNRPVNKTCLPLREVFEKGYIERKELVDLWTINHVKHNEDAWEHFENLFSYFEVIDMDLNVLHAYYLEAFEYYLKNNISHIEIHLLLSDDPKEAKDTVLTIRSAYYEVKKKHPQLSVLVIGSGMKMQGFDLDDALKRLENCVEIMGSIRDDSDPDDIHDFVVGFDLINEEDISRPLMEYAPMLLEFKQRHPLLKYFLHCGESLDPRSNNLIDAYLLDACRVGHGMNLYRYPHLLREYANKEICLEVCPISNQALRYTRDIRLHPAAEYLKRGVTLSLCSDDPMFFEKETLTDDFMAAIVCWDLKLVDIKQLCLNSLMYSSMDKLQKRKAQKYWFEQWNRFMEEVIAENSL